MPPRGERDAEVHRVTPAAPNDNEPVVFDASPSTSSDGNRSCSGCGTSATAAPAAAAASSTRSGRSGHLRRHADGRRQHRRVGVADTERRSSARARCRRRPSSRRRPSPVIGQQVNFNASASRARRRAARSAASRGTSATAPAARASTATHAYANAGTFTVLLTVTDDAGRFATSSQSDHGGHRQPDGGLHLQSVGAAIGTAGDVRRVGDAGRGRAGRSCPYSWSFGDGGSGTGQTVTHTFTHASRPRRDLQRAADGDRQRRARRDSVTKRDHGQSVTRRW